MFRTAPVSLVALVIVAWAVLCGCGDDAESSSFDTFPSSAAVLGDWAVTLERPAGAEEVGPLCHVFDGSISGTYTEYESPDDESAVAVLELDGAPAEITQLEDLYKRLDECADDDLRIESGDGPVIWEVQVVVDDAEGEIQLVGFVGDKDRARVAIAAGPSAASILDELF